ncbi:MAG: biopolymer transporter ExbD [Planctomycetes bacterium]|nr:biopolymer transporter ExbD [Planctomycetota bacterium]
MTPLLDLVLQLVMFFMISANFVMEQTSIEVKLPDAVSAKPLPVESDRVIFLNINEKGQVLLPPVDREGNNDTLDNAAQVKGYMERRAAAEKIKTRKDKPEATLILRIDKLCPFEKSFPIMQSCRAAGYSNVQLRAYRFSGQGE